MTAGSDNSPRLLILGALGFIGRHLVRRATEQGFETLGTQSGRHSGPLPIFRLGEDRVLDCIDREFFRGDGPCWVVYATNFGSVDQCYMHPKESRRVNVEAVQRIMEDLRADHIRHIFLSTSYVFDGEQGNYSEDAPCRPLNLYGRQKREIELWMEENEPNSLILRLDKIVGTNPREAHLFSQWQRLVAAGMPIVCMRGIVFSPTLVDDVVEGILSACRLGLHGLYHLAPDESHSREDLARQFLAVTNTHTDILVKTHTELGIIEPRPPRTHLNGTRFRMVAGHQCTRMEAALANFSQRQREPIDGDHIPADET